MTKSIDYNGVKITYTIEGNGAVLVLLHGFGEDSTVWQSQVAFLRNGATVITPDLPGSGASAYLPGEAISMDLYATVVNHILEQENVDKCTMLGHSMGGYIMLAFAEMFPEKLSGFGFVNSTAFADNADKKQSRLQAIGMIEEHGAYSFLKNSVPGLFSKASKTTCANEIAELIEKGNQFSNEALVQYYTAMMNRPDRTSVLEQATVPVLFIAGKEDAAAPLNDVLQQVHLPNVSVIHLLDNVGHMSMLEAKDEVNQFIQDFLTQTDTVKNSLSIH